MNFEDIAPKIFSCSSYNRGICRLDLDEACYLYKLVKSLIKPLIIELGTYKAGTTALLASATSGKVMSIDNYSSKTFNNIDGYEEAYNFLCNMNLSEKVILYVDDTRNSSHAQKNICDLIFIDGDHSYQGVKADYEHWIDSLKDNGHLLFHDSCGKEQGRIRKSEVPKLMPEIPYKKVNEVGSITHFIKEYK